MKVLSWVCALFLIALLLPSFAYAIVFLPALILIPIAKIVAVVIGAFSFPSVGLGVIGKKLFGGSTRKAIAFVVLFLVLLAVLLVIILKIENPQRPLF